jgi:hypothetical protein
MKKLMMLGAVVTAVLIGGSMALAQDDEAVPTFGAYSLEPGFLPDPFIVSVIGGGPNDASTLGLGEGCIGYVAETPDVSFTYAVAPEGFRIFFIGDSDATLLVQKPDGTFVCNDDSVGLDPAIEFIGEAEGTYSVWIGTFASDAPSFGYVMLTEVQESVPGNILTPIANFITQFVPMEEFMGTTEGS